MKLSQLITYLRHIFSTTYHIPVCLNFRYSVVNGEMFTNVNSQVDLGVSVACSKIETQSPDNG